ncbi:tetratricopeptide repeat protein [Sulfuriflexus mobilis]|uniref:tetratricopeptide repeat protein n=1 Tax=Sulfuriflexus mobilis TaxID=1811807 RepID=UPI0018D594F8|nr:tetratricopeptide repeat protein [Sulfuriflexus mobilis]
MKMIKSILFSIIAVLLFSSATLQADMLQSLTGNLELDNDIRHLQQEWALIKYREKDKDRQVKRMEALAKQAADINARYPDFAEPKIWEAIIVSSQAGIQGGFGALSLVKRSKALLETAEKIKPEALDGSAYTSLGSLYYQVPGWPIGFGDDGKARAYLEQARALNPNGIDSNYFYGDFLLDQGEYDKAIKVLEQALRAPQRPDRPVADAGRRDEIRQAIAKAKQNLDNN